MEVSATVCEETTLDMECPRGYFIEVSTAETVVFPWNKNSLHTSLCYVSTLFTLLAFEKN